MRFCKQVPDEGCATTVKEFDNVRGLRFCEIFLIGGNAITKNLKAAVYNTTGLNYRDDPLDSCPDELVDQSGSRPRTRSTTRCWPRTSTSQGSGSTTT